MSQHFIVHGDKFNTEQVRQSTSDMPLFVDATDAITSDNNVIQLGDSDDDNDILVSSEEQTEPGFCTPVKNRPLLKPNLNDPKTWATLHIGDSVQLQDSTFLRIMKISSEISTGSYYLHGKLLKQNRCLEGKLRLYRGELYWEGGTSDERISLDKVLCKREILMTGQSYSQVKPPGSLVCRWLHITIGQNMKTETLIRFLNPNECDNRTTIATGDQVLALALSPRVELLFPAARSEDSPSKSKAKRKAIELEGTTPTPASVSAKTPVRLDRTMLSALSTADPTRWTIEVSLPSGCVPTKGTFVVLLQHEDGPRLETVEYDFAAQIKTVAQVSSSKSEQKQPKVKPDYLESPTKRIRPSAPLSPRRSFVVDLRETTPVPQATGSARRYTFGDAFCGGGGVSSGARQIEELKIVFAIDHNAAACATYRLNCGNETTVYEMDIYEFIQHCAVLKVRVDILWLSPPCQTWSPAHTRAGSNDDSNQAALFAIQSLLQRCRPRIAILEQTFGLSTHHTAYLNAVICMITDAVYSVRWKILNFMDYGCVQPRRRLIIIAARHGDKLPEFPTPTHSIDPSNGLRPPTTVQDILRSVQNHWDDRIPQNFTVAKEPWSAKQPLTQTICTGTNIVHPNGRRNCSLREVAALQGFPNDWIFAKSVKGPEMTQIGNAVPSSIAKILLEAALKSLKNTDAARRRN